MPTLVLPSETLPVDLPDESCCQPSEVPCGRPHAPVNQNAVWLVSLCSYSCHSSFHDRTQRSKMALSAVSCFARALAAHPGSSIPACSRSHSQCPPASLGMTSLGLSRWVERSVPSTWFRGRTTCASKNAGTWSIASGGVKRGAALTSARKTDLCGQSTIAMSTGSRPLCTVTSLERLAAKCSTSSSRRASAVTGPIVPEPSLFPG